MRGRLRPFWCVSAVGGGWASCPDVANRVSVYWGSQKFGDISVLQAFNLEKMEPVCSKRFPGNMLDVTAYEAFIRENGVRDGILVGDKAFQSSAIEGTLSDNIRLHFLNPIKRNARFIKTHGMMKFEGKLIGHEGVVYKKAKCKGGRKWLYSFRDIRTWFVNRRKCRSELIMRIFSGGGGILLK